MSSLFFLYIFLNINFYSKEANNNYECDIENPLFDLKLNICVSSRFNETEYIIANKLTKIQWMNRINQIGIVENWFMGYDISSFGDLIIQSVRYIKDVIIKERYFYAIKANGREFFYNKETNKFINQIMLTII